MDGNNETQVNKMRKKDKLFADHIQTSNLNPSETWHAFKTTIMKTFEYPMEAINLTKVNWDYIMAPVLQVCLPKSGIVRTFPRTVLYTSPTHNGLGIRHPYYQQHIKQLHLCLEQTTSRNITHKSPRFQCRTTPTRTRN